MNDARHQIRRSLSFGSLSQSLSINDFHLIKVLGKGSFGKVFLVRPIRAPQSEVYAMKVLRKAEVVKRHQVEHTLTERYILATVRHPFVLCLRHAFQTTDKLYMVTDYCPGGELFFHLKRLRRFTEGMMRFYSAQISIALAHLHAHQIIYRDLKPENILLDQQGNVKLTDFGLSKRLMTGMNVPLKNTEMTFCGTPEYLSPEMITHRKTLSGYGREVDWWSLGIVCFELLTGWPPFYDRDFNRMCEKILYRPLVFPTQKYNLTKDAEDLVRSYLQRDPTKRIRYHLELQSNNAEAFQSSYSVGTATTTSSSFSSNLPVPPPNSNQSAMNLMSAAMSISRSQNNPHAAAVTAAMKGGAGTERDPTVLQHHPFYSGLDWDRLIECKLEPPFVPPRPREITDTCNFDKEFTKLSVKDSTDQNQKGMGGKHLNNNEPEKDVSLSSSFFFLFLLEIFVIDIYLCFF
jgi:serine/threonine protein kinase